MRSGALADLPGVRGEKGTGIIKRPSPDSPYDVIYHNNLAEFETTNRAMKRFTVSGDHVFVMEIDGGAIWGIKFGDSPRIFPIRRYATYRRRFRSITLMELGRGAFGISAFNQPSGVALIVSVGRLVLDPGAEDNSGFGANSDGRINCVANTVARSIFADAQLSPDPLDLHPFGRYGAQLFVRNSDMVNTLILAQQLYNPTFAGQWRDYYRLYPGESLTLSLNGRIFFPGKGGGLYVRT